MSEAAKRARRLRQQGFDKAFVDRSTGAVCVRCSQCEALVICGVPCHEKGCPNEVRDDD